MDRLKFSTSSTTLLSMIGIKMNVPLLPGDMFAFLVVESKSIPFPVYKIIIDTVVNCDKCKTLCSNSHGYNLNSNRLLQ